MYGRPRTPDFTEGRASPRYHYPYDRGHTGLELFVPSHVEDIFEADLDVATCDSSHEFAVGLGNASEFSFDCLQDDFVGDLNAMGEVLPQTQLLTVPRRPSEFQPVEGPWVPQAVTVTLPPSIGGPCIPSIEVYLWHHYITQAATDLVCFNTNPPHFVLDYRISFTTHIPHLAFKYPYLFRAILAVSGVHHGRKKGLNSFGPLCDRLVFQTQQDLAGHLARSTRDFEGILAALATSEMLCLCHMHFQDTSIWSSNLEVSRTLASQISKHQDRAGYDDGLVYFLLTLQKYLEIVSRLSFGTLHLISGEPTSENFEEQDNSTFISPGYESTTRHVVDPLLSFSPRLVGPLLRIGEHIQRPKSISKSPTLCESQAVLSDRSPIDADELDQLEEALLEAEEADLQEFTIGSNDNAEFRALNEAMHATAFLLFYGRLRNLPFTSMLVRQQVSRIVSASQAIIPGSRSSTALILPLVIAGCEAVNAHDRSMIFQCLQGLRGTSLCDLDRISDFLKTTWMLRDETPYLTGLEWQSEGLLKS
jgi:hypothetical protein